MAKRPSNPRPRRTGKPKPSTSPSKSPAAGDSQAARRRNQPRSSKQTRGGGTGSTGDLERDMELRETLLEGSLAQVFFVYQGALEDQVKRPVVVLVDCGDSIGGRLARVWAGEEAVKQALSERTETSETVTLAEPLSFSAARRDLGEMFPYLAGTFTKPPDPGQFVAVVVAYGGAGSFFVPLDALDGQ